MQEKHGSLPNGSTIQIPSVVSAELRQKWYEEIGKRTVHSFEEVRGIIGDLQSIESRLLSLTRFQILASYASLATPTEETPSEPTNKCCSGTDGNGIV